jgi:creatinine amidohydrolase/Fe(II)-dependent formamide hydrolase-like protein
VLLNTKWYYMFPLLSYLEIEKKIEGCHDRRCKAVAFFPIGCTEQHGPFLPIQTDTIIAENVSRSLSDAISDKNWGYVFPAICYTPTKSNTNFTGTVSVDEELLRQYVKQICSNILTTGFDAIVLVSGHGPADSSLIEISFNLVHEQYAKKCPTVKPVFVLSLNECKVIVENKFEQKSGQHADWRELLYLVYILGNTYFDNKKVNDIIEFQRLHSFPIKKYPVFGVPMELRSVQGVIGDPTPAVKEDWNDLAKIAWAETINHLTHLLKHKLNCFWSKDTSLC